MPQELELSDYLVHCEARSAEEHDRCEAYLGLAMRRPLKDILDQCLLVAHLTSILDGSQHLFAATADQDLARFFR